MKKQLMILGGMLLFGFIFPVTFLVGANGFTHLIRLIKQIIGI